jgi:hypothetical protein
VPAAVQRRPNTLSLVQDPLARDLATDHLRHPAEAEQSVRETLRHGGIVATREDAVNDRDGTDPWDLCVLVM